MGDRECLKFHGDWGGEAGLLYLAQLRGGGALLHCSCCEWCPGGIQSGADAHSTAAYMIFLKRKKQNKKPPQQTTNYFL